MNGTSPDDISVELRVALAMRGGVSLAVWIGGACAEVDALRRSVSEASPGDADFYAHLARFAGYSDVTVDVMAGASAGGLNAALLASAIAYGADIEQMRELWIDLANIDELFHRPDDSPITSLLRGNEYFLTKLEEQLTTLTSGEWQQPRTLDVLLAATLLSPARVYAQQGDDVTVESRAAASFHFHAGAEPWLNVFEQDGPTRPIASKLALAGRATSSFPAAFEPAAIYAARPESFAAAAAGPTAASGPSGVAPMWGVFSLAQPRDAHEPFLVIDGGVLDNIPIAKAIDRIARARADGLTDRVLLFMHPSPGANDASEKKGDASLVGVLRATATTRLSQESILDDLAVLESFNHDATAFHNARSTLLAGMRRDQDSDVVDGILWSAAASLEQWRTATTVAAALHVRRLLEDPVAVIGVDRFPDAVMTNPLDTASPPITAEQRRELFQTLETEIGRDHDVSPLEPAAGGLERVGRLAQILRVAVQSFERNTTDPATLKRLGAVKANLYSVTLAVETLAAVGAAAWPALATTQADKLRDAPSSWAIDTIPVVQQLIERHDPAMLARLTSALQQCLDGSMAAAAEAAVCDALAAMQGRAMGQLDALVTGQDATAADGDAVSALWGVLESVAAALGQVADSVDLDASSHGPIAQLFRSAAVHSTTERLCALDVVLLPLALLAPPGDRDIRFVRVAGTNPTPLADWFTRLRPADDGSGTLPVSQKLAGNQLGNFSAFLRPEYRANDWMWGRVDSSYALLGILLDPDRVRVRLRSVSVDDLLELLHQASLASTWLGAAEVNARWSQNGATIRHELETLRDDTEGTASLPQTTDLFRRWRHIELIGRELPKVLAMMGRNGSSPASAEDLQKLAATYKVVPDKIAHRPWREILPNVDQLRQVAYAAVRPPTPNGDTGAPGTAAKTSRLLNWVLKRANATAAFFLRHRLGWVIYSGLASALLLVAGLVLAFFPVSNWVPIAVWAGAVLVLVLGVLIARKRPRVAGPLSDAFTRVSDDD